ncbi:family 2 encapsulin nanocompartment cargo protein terpene cyclase [Streptacidiphilus sp. EB129]|uniref:family 2 encapsulin nanocompartment cargo protein terpene cyclase n=1 Tax=Streptacidiphilus sp. EB129 TaxID=3156262 RepID=UPI0035197EBA
MSLLSRISALLEAALPDPAVPADTAATGAVPTGTSPVGSASARPTGLRPGTAAPPAAAASAQPTGFRPAIAAPAAVLGGPTGLGTAGLRIPPPPVTAAHVTAAHVTTSHVSTPHVTASRPAGGVPPLYCPEPVRDDPALGRIVNERLVAWAGEVGIYPGQLERVRAADFGRLVMLTHPDSDDPDRLLAAAKCALAEWATDDHYCDDASLGATPELLGARLGLALSVVEGAQLPFRYAAEWERGMREDPVLVSLRSAFEHLSRYARPDQVARLRHEIAGLFTAYNQEGSWRVSERSPAVWQYLSHRQINSFLPCIAMVDVVGGYRLPAAEYSAPPVRRVIRLASLASTLVNDLYSMGKEDQATGVDFNLPALIAAEEHCSLAGAARRAARIHDELVHTVEAEAALLGLGGSPELKRYLSAVWAWLGGNHEWHRGSRRYNPGS